MRHRRWSLFAAIVAASLAWLAASPLHAQAPRVTFFEGARLITGDGVVDRGRGLHRRQRPVRRGRTARPAAAAARRGAGRPLRQDGDAGAGRRPRAHGLPQGHELLRRQLHAREPDRHARPLRLLRHRRDPRDRHRRAATCRIRSAPRRAPRRAISPPAQASACPMPAPAARCATAPMASPPRRRRAATCASSPPTSPTWSRSGSTTATARCEKLTPALYRAIIDEAHKHNIRVMAHVFALDDVKDLRARRHRRLRPHGARQGRRRRAASDCSSSGPTCSSSRRCGASGARSTPRSRPGSTIRRCARRSRRRTSRSSASSSRPTPRPIRRRSRAPARSARPTCATPRSSTPPACGSGSAPTPAA